MKSATRTDLMALVSNALMLKNEIQVREKLLNEVKEQISPFMNPGEMISCELGTVQKKKGKSSFTPNKEGKVKLELFKQQLESQKLAVTSIGDPYLEFKTGKTIT